MSTVCEHQVSLKQFLLYLHLGRKSPINRSRSHWRRQVTQLSDVSDMLMRGIAKVVVESAPSHYTFIPSFGFILPMLCLRTGFSKLLSHCCPSQFPVWTCIRKSPPVCQDTVALLSPPVTSNSQLAAQAHWCVHFRQLLGKGALSPCLKFNLFAVWCFRDMLK